MARALVTGGAGFIGSHIAHALVERGDQIRIFDNFSTGSLDNLAGIEDQVEIVRGDLTKQADVRHAVEDIDLVFHEAAQVSVPESIEKPMDCYAINVGGTIELLQAAKQAGVQRAVIASSAAVYGESGQLPLSEYSTVETLSPYAASKYFNEVLAQVYSSAHKFPVVALRYFNVYGPRQSPTSAYAAAIPRFIDRLATGQAPTVYGVGTQTRDFIFVGDVVRANLLAAEKQGVAGKVFNICSGSETSLLDLLSTLARLIPGAPAPEFASPRLGDVPRSVGDPSLAANELGFKAQVSLADGLQACVKEWAL
jgi:nucleoside-diphosphate-sugar epimerase